MVTASPVLTTITEPYEEVSVALPETKYRNSLYGNPRGPFISSWAGLATSGFGQRFARSASLFSLCALYLTAACPTIRISFNAAFHPQVVPNRGNPAHSSHKPQPPTCGDF